MGASRMQAGFFTDEELAGSNGVLWDPETTGPTPGAPAPKPKVPGIPADAEDPGNAMIVEVDGAKRTIEVSAGTSVDVFGKKIRVKAATGGDGPFVEGWYVFVS